MDASERVGEVFRESYGKVLSHLLARGFDLLRSEDAVSAAFASALTDWNDAPPPNPEAWLCRVALHRAIDTERREKRLSPLDIVADTAATTEPEDPTMLPDERLRLFFFAPIRPLPPKSRLRSCFNSFSACLRRICRSFSSCPLPPSANVWLGRSGRFVTQISFPTCRIRTNSSIACQVCCKPFMGSIQGTGDLRTHRSSGPCPLANGGFGRRSRSDGPLRASALL